MTNRLLRLLCEALAAAVKEIKEHNNEYHHRTSDDKIAEWDKLVADTRRSL